MSVLAEIDVNARRKPSTTRQALKQSSLFDFTASKHQPRVSSEPEDDGYTSAYESTRVHPSSTTALEGDERPLKKRLRRHVVATANDSSDEEGDVERILPSQRKVPSVINAATLLARRGLAPATSRSTLTRSRGELFFSLLPPRSSVACSQPLCLPQHLCLERCARRIPHHVGARQDLCPALCRDVQQRCVVLPSLGIAWYADARIASLRGGKQLLAVSDEEGMVSFIDSSRNANEDRGAFPAFL